MRLRPVLSLSTPGATLGFSSLCPARPADCPDSARYFVGSLSEQGTTLTTSVRAALPAIPVRLPKPVPPCSGKGEVMYPPDNATGKRIEIAKSTCTGCPIRGWCAQAGRYEDEGVWAGHSAKERRAARKRTALRTGKTPLSPAGWRLRHLITVGAGAELDAKLIAETWDVGWNPAAGSRQVRRMRAGLTS